MSIDKNLKTDYEYSRDTYYDLLDKGKASLDLMMEVARESEHPRAFEVLSGMVKNLADVNDKLMDLNKKNKDLNTAEREDVKSITNNNVFLGSTADLQKLLQNEKNIIDVEPTTELPRES